jgi:acyl-CoA synthetase (NDP forming)
VDEILHVVDKRESAEVYQRLPTIAQLAARLAAAAGKSTNVELVNQITKLGGNGPIMANALASFGLKVTYLGNCWVIPPASGLSGFRQAGRGA